MAIERPPRKLPPQPRSPTNGYLECVFAAAVGYAYVTFPTSPGFLHAISAIVSGVPSAARLQLTKFKDKEVLCEAPLWVFERGGYSLPIPLRCQAGQAFELKLVGPLHHNPQLTAGNIALFISISLNG